MGYASELRKQMAEAGYTAEQINGMLGTGEDEVKLDEVEPSGGQQQGKGGFNMDVMKALSGGKGGSGSGVSLNDIGQGVSFSPASSGGSGLGSSGGGYSAPSGFDGYTGGSGLSTSGGGQGLQMGNTQGVSYSPVSEGGTGMGTSGGDSGGGMGGGWASAIAGAMAGIGAATNRRKEYEAKGEKDPYMAKGEEEGFGVYHEDQRDIAGGGVLGGVLGYFGGPIGSAVAGPVVDAVHPYGEKLSRFMVTTGDDLGGVGGAMTLDPIGTMASGKYSWSDIIKGGILGPAADLF